MYKTIQLVAIMLLDKMLNQAPVRDQKRAVITYHICEIDSETLFPECEVLATDILS